mmetsp:Transcript_12534/g.18265  ORF Transcript_12534/g.18265 Transcript_12534/m.18265 type:complete len:234 (-) Transcript_12534:324-1025(-)
MTSLNTYIYSSIHSFVHFLLTVSTTLSFSKHATQKFLRNISKLIIILPRKICHGLLGDVPKFILLRSLVTQKSLDPIPSAILNLLRNISKFVIFLINEVEDPGSGSTVDFLGEVTEFVFVLAAEIGNGGFDSRINFFGQVSGFVIILSGNLTGHILANFIQSHGEIAQFVLFLAPNLGNFILDSAIYFLCDVSNLVIFFPDEILGILLRLLDDGNTDQFGEFHGKSHPFIIRD